MEISNIYMENLEIYKILPYRRKNNLKWLSEVANNP